MDNPNFPNEPNEDILEENPVIPEPNHVKDAHDPNEMVDIPDDEDLDLVDHDGDDEEPQEEPEAEPEQEPKEEPEQQIGHGNYDALEGYCDCLEHLRVIEDLSTRLGNLEYRHGVLMRKMEEVNDAEVADSIAIGEIQPRVATVGEQVQVMKSQAVQVVSGLKEIENRVQQVESRVDTYSSGQMAVPRQDEIIGLSQQMLWMEERLTVLEKRLPGPPPGPQ
nr:hypothetical protein [Tanacetum cinerariifolium]